MAITYKKFLFQSSEGYSQVAGTDEGLDVSQLKVGDVVVSSAGVNMGSKALTGLPAPSATSDAATKSYVDGLASSSNADSLAAAKAYADAQDVIELAAAKSYADAQDAIELAAAKAYADAQDAIALAAAKSYADAQDVIELAAAKSYADAGDAATLTSAKSYADAQDVIELAAAKSYAEAQDAIALAAAKSYAEAQDAIALAAAKSYADTGDAATLVSAKSYADTGDAATLVSAKSYADTGDAATLVSAKSYADTNLAAAKSYADTGDAATLVSAKSYADAGDATALASAKTYADSVAIGLRDFKDAAQLKTTGNVTLAYTAATQAAGSPAAKASYNFGTGPNIKVEADDVGAGGNNYYIAFNYIYTGSQAATASLSGNTITVNIYGRVDQVWVPVPGFYQNTNIVTSTWADVVTALNVGGLPVNATVLTGGSNVASDAFSHQLMGGSDGSQGVITHATGIPAKGSLTDNANGSALKAGDRLLVTEQTAKAQNGLYVVTEIIHDAIDNADFALVARSADADNLNGGASASEVTNGMYVFVTGGDTWANTAWVLSTADTISLGTTALTFVQFSSMTDAAAGAGLSSSHVGASTVLSVGAGNGIAVGADDVSVDLSSAAAPGLQIVTESGKGKLAFKPNTNKGLDKDDDGAKVKLGNSLEFSGGSIVPVMGDGMAPLGAKIVVQSASADRISVSSSGVDVVGVPAQFKIDGTAVNTSVTASALNTLSAGATSEGDSLHYHAQVLEKWTASAGITAGRAVYMADDGGIKEASFSSAATSRVLGLAPSAIASGDPGFVQTSGLITLSGASLTAGTRYFLSDTGGLVEFSAVTSGSRAIQLGIAKSSTVLAVRVFDYGTKA